MASLNNAMAMSGCTYRELDYWVRRKFLFPKGSGLGSGTQRDWPIEEIKIAASIKVLRDAGVDLTIAAQLARNGQEGGGDAFPSLVRGHTACIRKGVYFEWATPVLRSAGQRVEPPRRSSFTAQISPYASVLHKPQEG